MQCDRPKGKGVIQHYAAGHAYAHHPYVWISVRGGFLVENDIPTITQVREV
jgi:tRNA nucleotidyltransferase (CCA-adding enzyme)